MRRSSAVLLIGLKGARSGLTAVLAAIPPVRNCPSPAGISWAYLRLETDRLGYRPVGGQDG